MRTMKELIKPSVLRFIKSVRLQRGGGWRAARVGVVVLVVVVWAWVYFVSPNTHTPPSLTHGDWSSGSPNLQVAAPIRGGGDTGRDKMETWRRNNIRIENQINPIRIEDEEERKGRVERRREGGILIEEEDKSIKQVNKKREEEEEEQEQDTNPRYNRIRENNLGLGKKMKDKQIFPNIFPKRRLILPGDTKLLEEEDEDEEEEEEVQEEEEEGKWKGRNKEENDNHAMEEDDDVGIDKNNDDFVEEDVGGEVKKKKRQRREKQRNEEVESNNNDKNIKDNPKKTDTVHKENENQRTNKENGHQKPIKENGNQLNKENAKQDLDLLAIEEEMRQRRSKVKQVCARYGLGPHAPPGAQRKVKHPPTPAYETFYIDRRDRLAWCPVYKAASTSWLYAFLGLAGISETYVKNTKEQVSTVARRVWPALSYDEAQQAASTCVKAIVVRHPFERLVSAFRDKLEQVTGGEAHGTEHFYQKYGKKIVEKYRYKNEGGGKIVEKHRNQDEVMGKLVDKYREGMEARIKGKNSENKRNNDGVGWKKDEMGGIGRYERAGVKDEREKGKWGTNDNFRENRDKEGELGPQNPPLRYSNAIEPDPHPPPPPPPPPPPQRYRHILEDVPPPHQPDVLDPHQPQPPPPQRYKHILVDNSPPALQEVESPPVRKEPTFSEFVRYLIDTDLTLYADDHWLPYYLSCTPCLVDFDVIAKFETLNRDQEFLLRKTNLGKKLSFSWQHLTKGNQTKEVVRSYFAHVSRSELLSLFSKYKLDFEMFGYSVDEYLNYVKAD